MTRSHTHRDGGPVCRFATKKECDAAYKAALQEHRDAYDRAQAERLAHEQEQRRRNIDAFIASEWDRMVTSAKES